jgi:hypothetical protein
MILLRGDDNETRCLHDLAQVPCWRSRDRWRRGDRAEAPLRIWSRFRAVERGHDSYAGRLGERFEAIGRGNLAVSRIGNDGRVVFAADRFDGALPEILSGLVGSRRIVLLRYDARRQAGSFVSRYDERRDLVRALELRQVLVRPHAL